LRSATLVRGFRFSRALAGGAVSRRAAAAIRFRRSGRLSASCRRYSRSPRPRNEASNRLPAGTTAQFRGATELQPKTAALATAVVQCTDHQYSNLTVMVVQRGATNVRVR